MWFQSKMIFNILLQITKYLAKVFFLCLLYSQFLGLLSEIIRPNQLNYMFVSWYNYYDIVVHYVFHMWCLYCLLKRWKLFSFLFFLVSIFFSKHTIIIYTHKHIHKNMTTYNHFSMFYCLFLFQFSRKKLFSPSNKSEHREGVIVIYRKVFFPLCCFNIK